MVTDRVRWFKLLRPPANLGTFASILQAYLFFFKSALKVFGLHAIIEFIYGVQ